MRKKKTIKSEVTKTFTLLGLLMLGMGGALIYSSMKSIHTFENLDKNHLDELFHAAEIRRDMTEIVFEYRLLSVEKENTDALLKQLKKTKNHLTQSLQAFATAINQDEMADKKIKSALNKLQADYQAFEITSEQMVQALFENKVAHHQKLNGELKALSSEIFTTLESMNQAINSNVHKEITSTITLLKNIDAGALALIGLTLLLSVFFVALLIRFVNSQVSETASRLSQQSQTLTTQMSSVTGDLQTNSDLLGQMSNQLSSISSTLTSNTTDQSAALQQSVASIEEITSMVKQTAEHSRDSMEVANRCRDDVKLGSSVVKKMSSSVGEISESNDRLSEIIQIFSDINNKTTVINDIVTKTQLLSFNASIEAARAGEHGKGFAVVAEEVGNLARLSGQAAEEIRVLLDESVNKVNGIIKMIQPRVEAGEQTALECVKVFEQIESQIINLSGMVNSISSAASEQQQGLEQSTSAMNQIERSTHENRSVIENSTQLANQIEGASSKVIQAIATLSDLAESNRHEILKVTHAHTTESTNATKPLGEVISMSHHSSERQFTPEEVAQMYQSAAGDDIPKHDDKRF